VLVAASLLAVAALAVPVVTGGGGGGGNVPGAIAPASAVEVLLATAADNAVTSTEGLQPGQWMRLTSSNEYGCPDADCGPGKVGEIESTTWVPYDQTGDWYLKRTDQDPPFPIVVARAGAFYGPIEEASWSDPTPEFYASLNLDTAALRASFYEDAKFVRPIDRDRTVVEDIGAVLSTGIVPAEVRAAIYEVLATIPDMEILQEQTSFSGRTGAAFGRFDVEDGYTTQLIIDTETGEYLGTRKVQTNGEIASNEAVTYDIVDGVPPEIVAQAVRERWVPFRWEGEPLSSSD
jgi:hypothetical protein